MTVLVNGFMVKRLRRTVNQLPSVPR